jgi:hypothetical protein
MERRYWRITDLVPESLGGKEATDALWQSLVNAAQKIGSRFERITCDLTAGYDSRTLCAAFLGAGIRFSTAVSGAANSPDVVISKLLAKRFDLPHWHVAREPVHVDQVNRTLLITDGEFDLAEYASIFRIHAVLSQAHDISINGSFGEIARGHWWELLFPRTGARCKLDVRKVARLRFAAQPYNAYLFPQQNRLNLAAHLAEVIERVNEGLCVYPNTTQLDNAYLTMRMQRWQGRIASSTNRLWPCLSPFMFRSVLETMLQVEAKMRRRGLLIRRMLAHFQPGLAEVPLDRGYPAEPVSWRNFYRFWPLPKYYAGRALVKILRKLGHSPPTVASQMPQRLRLWQEPAVKAIMQVSSMRSGCLLDAAALEGFLEQSRQPDFSFNDQWTRLLSFEYTLRSLESVGALPAAYRSS